MALLREPVAPERLAGLGIRSPQALFAGGIFFAEIEPEIRPYCIDVFEEVKAGF